MKKATKIIALLLCAVLLVGATIAGTVAYLTANDSVTNTFTVGNVAISMVETLVDEYGDAATAADGSTTTETGNRYKLIPGHTYTKDPTITVSTGSEDCYIFVEIVNELGAAAVLKKSNDWTVVSEDTASNTYVWVYGTAAEPVAVAAGDDAVVPFDKFTFDTDADPADFEESSILVNAYAIQADGLDDKTAAELWTLLNP